MKLFLITLVLSLIAGSLAGIAVGNFSTDEHPDKCVFDGKVFSSGDRYQPGGKCTLFECASKGIGRIVQCGVQGATPPCKLGDFEDPNGEFPSCCKRKVTCD